MGDLSGQTIMQELESCLQELKGAVRSGVRDHSLLGEFGRAVQVVKLDEQTVDLYCQLLFSLYDLSNNHIFLRRSKANETEVDELAMGMKLWVLRMLSKVVAFFNDHPHLDLPLPLTRQSLQIMVLLSRVLLDAGKSYPTQIRQLYPLCSTFYDAFPYEIAPELQLLHVLNLIELLKYASDTSLDVPEFRRLLDLFSSKLRAYSGPCNYQQFVHLIVLEVVLKLLKRGSQEQARLITPYLPPKMLETINSLSAMDQRAVGEDSAQLRVSPFYELFLQIRDSGIDNISEERLRLFIGKQEHFGDSRLFDVVALTGETLPLQIWLELNLNSKGRGDMVALAYRCFVYVVDLELDKPQPSLENPTQLCAKFKAQQAKLCKMVRVAQMVLLNLLSEKRETGDPLLNILKRLIKILVQMVVTLHPNPSAVKQYADKLQLICSKHALADMSRSITCISFYYQLVMGIANEDSYSRFTKTHLLDKSSQLYKLIKLAFQFRMERYRPAEGEERELLKKEPYLAILFQKSIRNTIILKMPLDYFLRLPQKFEIYFLIMHSMVGEGAVGGDWIELATHMEECLIGTDLGSLNRLDLKYLGDMEKIMMDELAGDKYGQADLNVKMGIVLLYMACIRGFQRKMGNLNMGILLNRYSKILKMMSFAVQEMGALPLQDRNDFTQHFLYLSKLVLSWGLQKLKLQYKEGEVINEAGYLILVDLLFQLILKQETVASVLEFFRFVRFQTLCLCDNLSENEISFEKSAKLLKLYCSSLFIKKPIKLKILRKLIREDLASDGRQATLEDLSQLISLTDDAKEKKLYAEHIIRMFGQEGKKYLMLNCAISKDYDFLSQWVDGDNQDV